MIYLMEDDKYLRVFFQQAKIVSILFVLVCGLMTQVFVLKKKYIYSVYSWQQNTAAINLHGCPAFTQSTKYQQVEYVQRGLWQSLTMS